MIDLRYKWSRCHGRVSSFKENQTQVKCSFYVYWKIISEKSLIYSKINFLPNITFILKDPNIV